MILTAIIFALSSLYVLRSVVIKRRHLVMMSNYKHRIHVNGIRGKSSVTRLVAASLREGGIRTLGKTTGTAARLIIDHQTDIIVERKEADIVEQKRVINQNAAKDYEAIVFECMAINPVYQAYLENNIMHSDIGIITNVREDHMDLLGKTLPEIARSLCSTVPKNGHLVTAEHNPKLLSVIREECNIRGTKLHIVYEKTIRDKEMSNFQHFEYKANVAIAIKVAKICGISRNDALQGMYKAQPDPGAFVLKTIASGYKQMHWANLFAINDRESFVLTAHNLSQKVTSDAKKVVILNNRQDRPERVSQFVDIAVNTVKADYVITFGDFEKQVKKEVARLSTPTRSVRVIHMGNKSQYKNASGQELLDRIIDEIQEPEFMVLGAVNIHTQQSQSLLRALGESYAH